MTAPKQVDFIDGTTVVSADFLDRIQEIQSGLATNMALAISGTSIVLNAGSGNSVASITIGEKFRYVESPQSIAFSGSDPANTYGIWATTTATDTNPSFTLVKVAGSSAPSAAYYRLVGTVDWNGSSALSNLVQVAGYDKHGYMHTLSGDPLPSGSVSSAQIVDGTIVLADLAASLQQMLVPTGTVLPFCGASAPSAYLLCDGSQVSRTTYADLFAALGGTSSPYGLGDGSSTFNVPDLRGRVIAGRDNMGGTAASRLSNIITGSLLGSFGGVEQHTLLSSESGLPSHTTQNDGGHTHTVGQDSPDHAHGGTTDPGGYHDHGMPYRGSNAAGGTFSFQMLNGNSAFGLNNVGAGGTHSHTFTTHGANARHSHAVTGGSHSHPVSAANASSPHTNVQPTLVLNYIIKT